MLTHLYQIVRERAERYPAAIAVGGQSGLAWKTLTTRQLLELVDLLACQLAARGVTQGDRVVIWAPNHWRTPVYLFALWKLGAIVVPFDREMNPESAARILDSVEPRCTLIGYDERPAWAHAAQMTEWWEPRRQPSDPAPDPAWSPPAEELAVISFTSGTTGQPKGCMITHANLCSQVEAAFKIIPLDPTCRLASILPLSHLFELTCGMLYPLAAGAAVHYIPSRRGPDVIRVLAEQRVTHMMVVPQLLGLMGQQIEQQLRRSLPQWLYARLVALAEGLSLVWRRRLYWMVHRKLGGQLSMLLSGGAPLAPETQRLWERLGVRVVQGYGASECSPMIACGRPDGSTPVGSVGQAVPGGAVRLSPEGELLVLGPNVMRGYWKDPSRTAEVLQDDGWYATGDLATIDAAGNVFLAGRAKELIVLPSGLKVWPQDVEDVLRAEAGVKDAVVVAAPTPGGGAVLHAYLIPSGPTAHSIDLGELVSRSNGRLAQHQRLASASWWTEPDFPRTSMLKIRRHLLPMPDRAAVIQVESVMAADDPVGQAVAGVAHVATVQDSQTLGELGLDSLGLVELALALEEKTEKAVADGDLRLEMSVDQVRTFLAGAPPRDDERASATAGEVPEWPFTWGRAFRVLSLPFDLLYRVAVTRTVVLGREHLQRLPPLVIVAGTHRSFADVPLVRFGLGKTRARRLSRRLVVAAGAGGAGWRSPLARYGVLAFGLYPLERERERDASLRRLVRLAQDGNTILIFPQGTHARPEQERAQDPSVRFRPGVTHIATALGCPVVPFGLAGTERLMPAFLEEFHGRVIAGVPVSFTRGPLAIAFGEALRVQPDEDPAAFAARLETACYALAREAEQAIARCSG
jgi:long-chain acyl-CoA synthetase